MQSEGQMSKAVGLTSNLFIGRSLPPFTISLQCDLGLLIWSAEPLSYLINWKWSSKFHEKDYFLRITGWSAGSPMIVHMDVGLNISKNKGIVAIAEVEKWKC